MILLLFSLIFVSVIVGRPNSRSIGQPGIVWTVASQLYNNMCVHLVIIIYVQFALGEKNQWHQNHQDFTTMFALLQSCSSFNIEFMPVVSQLDFHSGWFKITYLKTQAQALKHLNMLKINFTYVIPSWMPLLMCVSFKRN